MSSSKVAYLALGVSILTFLWTEGRRFYVRCVLRQAGPITHVRETLTGIREAFGQIENAGGKTGDFFLSEKNKSLAQSLRDLASRVGDRRLTAEINTIANRWDEAFLSSHPKRVRVYDLGNIDGPFSEEEANDSKLRQLQVERAEAGLGNVTKALDRLNTLERRRSPS
jgi:hypothetical protein